MQKAIEDVSVPTGPAQDDVMLEVSRKKVRFANLSTSFVQMAKLGSESEQAEAIARRHIREMKTEFSQLNKVRIKKNPTKTTTTTSNVPPQTEAPSAPRQRAARNAPQQRAALGEPLHSATPTEAQRTAPPDATHHAPEAPNAPRQRTTCNAPQQRAAPNEAQ
jgi:hypothetical protein